MYRRQPCLVQVKLSIVRILLQRDVSEEHTALPLRHRSEKIFRISKNISKYCLAISEISQWTMQFTSAARDFAREPEQAWFGESLVLIDKSSISQDRCACCQTL